MKYRVALYRMFLMLVLIICLNSFSAGADWNYLDPALLTETVPTIEKDADVEGIFWEIWVTGEGRVFDSTVLKHYVRLKIYNERGIDYAKKAEIRYIDGLDVANIEGRTIKPDGTVVELSPDDVFETTLAASEKVGLKAKTFAMPALEPGVVVEYRWKETRFFNTFSRYLPRFDMPIHKETSLLNTFSRYPLQFDVPMRSVTLHLFPQDSRASMSAVLFNHPEKELEEDAGGYYKLTLQNVPAFRAEPLMPPEDSVRAFLLVSYLYFVTYSTTTDYWEELSKSTHKRINKQIKPNNDIKEKTSQVIGTSELPDEMIGKIFQFVRARIKNIDGDASGLTQQQREEFKENDTASGVLKKGMGTSYDILMLFASMLKAAGLDAWIAYTGDRSDFFFNPKHGTSCFLSRYNVAVQIADEWKFYNPSAKYLPFGMIPWQEEDNYAFITDSENPFFVIIPASPAENTLTKRKAILQLSEDGTLEGDIILEYTGHRGADKKESNDQASPVEREEILKSMVSDWISTAEITQISIENVTDPEKPFTYRFNIRIPGYGQTAGKRLFFQPALFQKGTDPLFQSNKREHDIFFHYAWSECDEIDIRLPDGYELESAVGRQPIKAGAAANYDLNIILSEDQRVLHLHRDFTFGGQNYLLFKVDNYPLLKQLFDSIHLSDNHTLALIKTTEQE